MVINGKQQLKQSYILNHGALFVRETGNLPFQILRMWREVREVFFCQPNSFISVLYITGNVQKGINGRVHTELSGKANGVLFVSHGKLAEEKFLKSVNFRKLQTGMEVKCSQKIISTEIQNLNCNVIKDIHGRHYLIIYV